MYKKIKENPLKKERERKKNITENIFFYIYFAQRSGSEIRLMKLFFQMCFFKVKDTFIWMNKKH